MADRIPREIIDQILTRTDIVALIDQYLPLKRAGVNFKACCPFHEEKTASFVVSPQKQIYHCFGCGAGGNAYGFLMEYERLSFIEAVKLLAKQHHIDLPTIQTSNTQFENTDDLYDVTTRAVKFYEQQLRQDPQSERAKNYLKNRGLTGELAKKFHLGFAPDGWDNLIRAIGSDAIATLEKAGLIIKKEANKQYDRFRDRIIFPIRNRQGKFIGLGGRVIDKGEPKYLNSPETPIFHKGKELYGLYECLNASRAPKRILIVEGYMDVIALAQHGIHFAVATLGTATSSDHIRTLFRYTPEIIFCFDGDNAGTAAAKRALSILLPQMQDGKLIRFMFLPEGEDPDSLVNRIGKEAFLKQITHATSLAEFFMTQCSEEVDLLLPDGRAQLIQNAKQHLNEMPDTQFKQMLIAEVATKARLPLPEIQKQIQSNPETNDIVLKPKTNDRPSLLRYTISLLLQHPSLAQLVDPNSLEPSSKAHKLLRQLLEFIHNTPQVTTAGILEQWRDNPAHPNLVQLAGEGMLLTEGLDQEFQSCIERLQSHSHSNEIEKLMFKMGKEGLTNDEKMKLQDLLKSSKR
ncbi:MAG: DNA primase [Gammaproteobacteria bacterium]